MYSKWLNELIRMGNNSQFSTNNCHYIKLNIKPFAFFWDFPKSLINEYNDLA